MKKQRLRVIKIGGQVVNDPKALDQFLRDFAELSGPKVLVHGGGKKATELASRLGLIPKMIEGRRVTDAETLDLVTMVYAGLINKSIVASLQALDCNALGLSGADAGSILAHKRPVQSVDYGFAGDVDRVDAERLKSFLDLGLNPVFCALTHDAQGQLLNTNADTIANELAKGLSSYFEVELIFCFELPGVLLDRNNLDSVVERLDWQEFQRLKENGLVNEGMIPKLLNCFQALEGGVDRVLLGQAAILGKPELKHTLIT